MQYTSLLRCKTLPRAGARAARTILTVVTWLSWQISTSSFRILPYCAGAYTLEHVSDCCVHELRQWPPRLSGACKLQAFHCSDKGKLVVLTERAASGSTKQGR